MFHWLPWWGVCIWKLQYVSSSLLVLLRTHNDTQTHTTSLTGYEMSRQLVEEHRVPEARWLPCCISSWTPSRKTVHSSWIKTKMETHTLLCIHKHALYSVARRCVRTRCYSALRCSHKHPRINTHCRPYFVKPHDSSSLTHVLLFTFWWFALFPLDTVAVAVVLLADPSVVSQGFPSPGFGHCDSPSFGSAADELPHR